MNQDRKANEQHRLLNVFVPKECANVEDVVLFGGVRFSESAAIAVICGTLDVTKLAKFCGGRFGGQDASPFPLAALNCKVPDSVFRESPFWLSVEKVDECSPSLWGYALHGSMAEEFSALTVFEYDGRAMLESKFLVEESEAQKAPKSNEFSVQLLVDIMREFEERNDEDVNSFNKPRTADATGSCDRSEYSQKLFSAFWEKLHKENSKICRAGEITNNLLMSASESWCQIHLRMRTIEDIPREKHRLRKCDLFLSLVLDVVLGLCIFLFFIGGNHIGTLEKFVLASVEEVVKSLQELLTWLMGVPAGLKLNKELDHTLARFFFFHVHLWQTYVFAFIKPVLGQVLYGVAVSGVFGATLQLTLLSDLISIFTIHAYCFYIYAARLYRLVFTGLTSLWRLFRGKKWNPLRERVDSAEYDMDQLFIGTLIFTVLLFLLPTVIMYYSVFTLLRVSVIVAKLLVVSLVHILNSLPLFTLLCRLFSSHATTGDIAVKVQHAENGPLQHLALCLTLKQCGIFKLYKHSHMSSWTEKRLQQGRCLECLKRLLTGQLISLWNEEK